MQLKHRAMCALHEGIDLSQWYMQRKNCKFEIFLQVLRWQDILYKQASAFLASACG
jgi:hypothetical protein